MSINISWKCETEDTKIKIEVDEDSKMALDLQDKKPVLTPSGTRLAKIEENDVKPTIFKTEPEATVKVEKVEEPEDIEMISVCEDSEAERMMECDSEPAIPNVKEHFEQDSARTIIEHNIALVQPKPRPKKRLVLESVQMPRLEDVLRSYHTHDSRAKLPCNQDEVKEVKKAKVKKNNMEWNLNTVTRRLDTIGHDLYPINLPNDSKQACFSRTFLCSLYGGNKRKTFPFDNKDDNDLVRGVPKNEFMYPNLNYNPHLPLIPGAPGLYSQANYPAGAEPWPRIQRVMVRVRVGVWQYMGQYQLIPTASLTKDEWKEQDVIVRKTWARKIYDKGWGRPLRVSITLRKRLGREPTHEEQQEALATDNTFQNHVTVADISAAFDCGEQALSVWCMKCVGYDTEFQRFLVARSATTTIPNARRDL